MTRWQMTLKQSGTTPSPNIGTLTLKNWQDPPTRSQINHITLGNFSPMNVPTLAGSNYLKSYHFTWQIAALLTSAQSRQFEALVGWQQSQFGSGSDGRLILTEEVEYLPPETTPHSRTVISGTGITESWGQVSGFGTYYVFATLGDTHKTQVGYSGVVNYKLVQFVLTEM